MSPALHLLWLLLLLCSLLLLVGCRATIVSTPPPFAPTVPPVSLTVVSFPPITLDIRTPFRPLLPNFALATVPRRTFVSPPPIPLEAPTCYEQPTKLILCLGRVINNGSVNLGDIQVAVQLGGAKQIVTIEQHTISPQSFAPYRAQFANTAPVPLALAQVVQARYTQVIGTALVLEDENGSYQKTANGYGYYDFSATVINPTATTALHPRLIITVLNQENTVVGYRVVEVADEIRNYQQFVIHTQIIPQLVSDNLYHYAKLEHDAIVAP